MTGRLRPWKTGDLWNKPPCPMATACRHRCSRWSVLVPAFAQDGRSHPGNHAQERQTGGRHRVFSPDTAVPFARCCRWRHRPVAPGNWQTPSGYSVGVSRYCAQTGWQGLRQQQIPRLVHRHGSHRAAARHRRCDDRRAQQRAALWRCGGCPVFSDVVQHRCAFWANSPTWRCTRRSWRRPWRRA